MGVSTCKVGVSSPVVSVRRAPARCVRVPQSFGAAGVGRGWASRSRVACRSVGEESGREDTEADKEAGASIRVGFSGDVGDGEPGASGSSSSSGSGVTPMTEAEQRKAQTLKVVTGALSLAVAALYLGLVQVMDARTALFGFVPMDDDINALTPKVGGATPGGTSAPGLAVDPCDQYPGC